MANTLLRSGDIKNFQALGQDGKAVYLFATQIRETFRMKLGQQYANHLAVPQRNDQGNIIDWYVPFESKNPDGEYDIVPWSAASDDEKKAALAQLHEFEQKVISLGQKMVSNINLSGDQLLFSRLVYNPQASSNNDEREKIIAIRFPSADFVYIVNGIPVITFWGFLSSQPQVTGSSFSCLEATNINSNKIPPITSPAVPITIAASKPWWKRWGWLLLALLLLLLLLFLLRGCMFKKQPVEIPPAPIAQVNSYLDDKPGINTGRQGIKNQGIVGTKADASNTLTSRGKSSLTGQNLDSNQIPDNTNPAVAAPILNDPKGNSEQSDNPLTPDLDQSSPENGENGQTNNAAPTDNKLTLSPDIIDQGSTQFLNGKWNVGGGIQDKTTGKPLRLQYDFDQGNGTVTISRGDGVKCVGNVGSGIAKGNLDISSSTNATCNDNSTYQLPKIQCVPGQNNVANCQGYYGDGAKFPITMKQQSDD